MFLRSFNTGDVVTVLRVDDSGWWDAQLGDNTGTVPGNYLEFLEAEVGKKGERKKGKTDRCA